MGEKTLWVISGGIEAVPGIKRAKEMGIHVVVSDLNPDAPGFYFADEKIIASTYDIQATLEAAKAYNKKVRPVHGVIAMAADVPMTVAAVAEGLGLKGISMETACLASDKLAMKRRFEESNISVPWFSLVESAAHLKRLINERGFPLIIKPVDSRGARGVLRIKDNTDLAWAYNYSLKYSPGGRVMAEEYIEGPQISTESVIFGNRVHTPGFADRNYELLDRFAPFIIENGGHQPSILSASQQKAVSSLAENAGRALGIGSGIAKGDMVMSKNGPVVIEVAARLSGGWFSALQVPLATGVDLVGAAIKLALGEELSNDELVKKYQKGVAIRYFFPKPGRVVAIKNVEQFEKTSWVKMLKIYAKIGDVVEPVTDHTKRAGCVITEGADRQEAISRAEEVVDTVAIKTIA